MSRLVLGLDLGEASVGGALLEVNDDDEILKVLWANSRVFSGVVDEKSKITLNAKRRGFRGQRRTIDRRAKRRRNVERALTIIGLLPEDAVERDRVLGRWSPKKEGRLLNPYEIRSRAIGEQVELFEIGRALQHILQRRGFRSNRKAKLADLIAPGSPFAGDEELRQWVRETDESVDVDEETDTMSAQIAGTDARSASQVVDGNESDVALQVDVGDDPRKTLDAINALKERWERSGLSTIGRYLHSLPEGQKKRKVNRLSREWLEDEFDRIWDFQSQFYPDILTTANKSLVRSAFEQRPLKPFRVLLPKRGYVAGVSSNEALRQFRACSLLGSAKPVARRGHWVSHRYRILETLRNLRLVVGDDVRELTPEEFVPLADELQSTPFLTWPKIRERLRVGRAGRFTIEGSKGSPNGIQGNTTEIALKKVFGEKWRADLHLTKDVEHAQLDFMQDIETYFGDPIHLFKLLQKPKSKHNPLYPLSKRQAFDVLCESFSTSTTNLSIQAMRRLHKDMLNGLLPHEAKDLQRAELQPEGKCEELPPPPPLRNPRVHRALTELRKVVNALIKKYGMPDLIRLELATELKETKADRDRVSKLTSDNKKLNKQAEEWFRAQPGQAGSQVSRKDKIKYRLWLQQREICPYCLENIGSTDLLNDTADIDHVLPIRRSGDDSISNKVLAHRACNARKGDRLPAEVWKPGTKEAKDRLAVIKKTGNRALLRKFQMEEVDDDFVARQLQDTRYITKEAVKYLKQLKMAGIEWGDDKLTVWPTNGQATGFLRRVWELNDLLPPLLTKKEVKAIEEANENGDGAEAEEIKRKNRNDHRHHAIDAIVVALTNPKRFKAAVEAYRGPKEHRPKSKANLYKPDKALIRTVINKAITSHAVNKGIRGALHDGSYYGRKELNGTILYVRRISVKELLKPDAKRPKLEETRKQIEERVYDPDLKRALLQRLSMGDWEEAFGSGNVQILNGRGQKMQVATVRVRHPKRSDDSTINIDIPGEKDSSHRYVAPESNHHAEIIRSPKGRLVHRVVTMIDAARALRSREDGKGSPYGLKVRSGETLLMCISKDESIEFNDQPMRVASTTSDCIWLRPPNDARTANEHESLRIRGDSLAKLGRKLSASPLGELTPTDAP